MSQAFPRLCRLRKRHQFINAQQAGLRFNRWGLLLLLKPNDMGQTRLGITVTRRSWPLATRRNYLRRLLREAFRQSLGILPPGWDMVAVITKNAGALKLEQAREAILWAMKRAEQKRA